MLSNAIIQRQMSSTPILSKLDTLHDPLQTLRGVDVAPRLIEEDRPLAESLEWRLSELYWNSYGTKGFIESRIPYTITSSGALSANVAQLLYANCCEHPPEDKLELLEIGSGTGLFARLFLEEFRKLCQAHGKPFFAQIVFYVTDRSRTSIEQWDKFGLFTGLPAVAGYSDAMDPLRVETRDGAKRLTSLRAAFCNYSLDSLPATVVRKGAAGPEELYVRTHLTADSARVLRHTKLSFAEIRELARTLDPQLIQLVPLFEFEASFQPCKQSYPYLQEALTFGHDATRTILNHGAIQSLEQVIPCLDAAGFVLINDYGAVRAEDTTAMSGTQRFGNSAASGLNFPFLEHHFSSNATSVLSPELDERLPIHPRLFTRAAIPETRRAFRAIFDWSSQQVQQEPQERARQHIEAGRMEAAKRAYEDALVQRPRDWVLLGEIAEFLIRQIGTYQAGLNLASAALAINPWYSVWLWNVYGDALYALERFSEAHQAYCCAAKLEPADVRTNLNLGYSFAQMGDEQSALESLGRGLANDRNGVFRERLLQKQQQIVSSVQARFGEEQEWLARRAARISSC